ncbi:hypothetical protein EI94DRAFT_1820795 [Lactarius quietus]|nr:hypothetical protein EI94DRAFT_1820795 [Lactarius quietus]
MNHVLYLSNQPFTDWTLNLTPSSQLLKQSQSFIHNITYTLSLQDAVSKRSKIASDVLQLVKTFFEGPQFENREDIKAYVFWALWSGGPAYYKTPILKSCRLKIDDPNCLKPDAKSALQPSLGPRNPPLGLYAMILTAVERAMQAYATGVFNPPGDFNQ